MISGFRREVAENYVRLDYHAAGSGYFKPDDGTDSLSRKTCKKLPLLATYRDADKSLARPGRKQATATKL